MAIQTIWTTELIQETIEKIRIGINADLSCFHERDFELRAGNILFHLSAEELEEFTKCSNDVVYFVEKYCRFLTDFGRVTISLTDYQTELLLKLTREHYISALDDFGPINRNLILMQSRQSYKTTTISAFLA
jgi:hypothetical protein